MKIKPNKPLWASLADPFLSAWFVMLGVGGLGHQMAQPWLFKFNYSDALLLVVIVWSLSPPKGTEYKLEEEK